MVVDIKYYYLKSNLSKKTIKIESLHALHYSFIHKIYQFKLKRRRQHTSKIHDLHEGTEHTNIADCI